MSQDSDTNFNQTTANPKTYLQLSDGRYLEIAQNIQTTASHHMPTTILVQMPFNLLDQSSTTAEQTLVNKRVTLSSRIDDKYPQHIQFQPKNDIQQLRVNQLKAVHDHSNNIPDGTKLSQNVSANGNIIALDKYQEICDMLQTKKLLTKISNNNEETVLVEFRLNQQKYQLRMTRAQKVDMERLLISAGNQHRQMEILQVYQSEQRKCMPQRTSVVLSQIINKNSANLLNTTSQIQALGIAKPFYSHNSVLMAVPPSPCNDKRVLQSSKNVVNQSTVSLQNSNGIVITNRLPVAQSSSMSVPSIPNDEMPQPIRDLSTPSSLTNPFSNSVSCIPNLSTNKDMKPARSRRFYNIRKILSDDQTSVIAPNCERSFEDQNDVARRLLPYHIIEECKEHSFGEVDRILSNTFNELMKKSINLKRIASSITMRDIITDTNDEQLLIKRMQLDIEMDEFEREKASRNDINCVVTPLPCVDNGNAVIIIEDTPPSSPYTNWDNNYDNNNIINNNNNQITLNRSISFVESMQTNDDTVPNDNLLDSVYNYDIQDITTEDFELDNWPMNDIENVCTIKRDQDNEHSSNEIAAQSSELDLHAAVY